MKILYNPRCSKCRNALHYLEDKGFKPEIVEYLKDTPTVEELKDILKTLGLKAKQLVRTSEGLYIEKFKDRNLTNQQWLKALVKYPQLIERPVILHNGKAVIGRSAEELLKITKA